MESVKVAVDRLLYLMIGISGATIASVWRFSLALQSGASVWRFSLALQSGASVWASNLFGN
jgi:hypothetical protein